MRRNKWFVIVLLIFSIAIEGCRLEHGQGIPLLNNELDSVKIDYDISFDIFQGSIDAKAYSLFINNSSSSDLKNCVLTINDEYKSQLKNMEYYYGIWKGSQKYGSSIFPAKTTLEFIFSHDISNHCVFLNANGKRLPTTVMIEKIEIVCHKGIGEWEFRPNMTHYQVSKVVNILILGVIVLLVFALILFLDLIF